MWATLRQPPSCPHTHSPGGNLFIKGMEDEVWSGDLVGDGESISIRARSTLKATREHSCSQPPQRRGLALYSTMMAVVGGTLSLDSAPGRYTRVRFTCAGGELRRCQQVQAQVGRCLASASSDNLSFFLFCFARGRAEAKAVKSPRCGGEHIRKVPHDCARWTCQPL